MKTSMIQECKTNLTGRSFNDVSAYRVLMAQPVTVSKQLPTYPTETEQRDRPIGILLLSSFKSNVYWRCVDGVTQYLPRISGRLWLTTVLSLAAFPSTLHRSHGEELACGRYCAESVAFLWTGKVFVVFDWIISEKWLFLCVKIPNLGLGNNA